MKRLRKLNRLYFFLIFPHGTRRYYKLYSSIKNSDHSLTFVFFKTFYVFFKRHFNSIVSGRSTRLLTFELNYFTSSYETLLMAK